VRPVTSKARSIERIMQARHDMTHAFAFARSGPLLAANLTMSQLKVLLVLARHDGASGHDLASALGVGPATLTGIVDRLVAHGLVTRREDSIDRRVRRVVLASAGREVVEAIIMAGGEQQRRILERLSVDELGVVERAFQLLLGAANADAAENTAADVPAPVRE
jgi:DNA-binding MarR family transcriptional regulator